MRAYFVFDLFAHTIDRCVIQWPNTRFITPQSVIWLQIYSKTIYQLHWYFSHCLSGNLGNSTIFFLIYKLLLHCMLGLRITFSLLLILKTFCYIIILQKIFFSILTTLL